MNNEKDLDKRVSTSSQRPSIREWVAIAIVLAIATPVLWPVLDGGFLTDDYQILHLVGAGMAYENGLDAANLAHVASFYVRQAHHNFQLYRPTPIAFYGITLLLCGTDPGPYMATNLILHLLATAIFAVFLKDYLPASSTVLRSAAALLFALSPIQMESVNWYAAKSETVPLIFGLTAMIIRLRRPNRRFLAIAAVLLALTAKETAVAFLLALAGFELFPPNADRSASKADASDLRRRLLRTWPYAVAAVSYLIFRKIIFGTLADASYNRKSLADYLDPAELSHRLATSFGRMIAPISPDVPMPDLLRSAAPAAFIVSVAVPLALGLFRLLRRDRGLLLIALALFLIPFLLGVMVNEVSALLVNSRAVYTSYAALLLVGVAGLSSIGRRSAVLAAVLLPALIVSIATARPSIRRYVDAARDFRETIAAVREPLRPHVDSLDRVLCLGYPWPDHVHFRGGFSLSGSVRPAFARPFLKKMLTLDRVASAEIAPDAEYISFVDAVGRADNKTAVVLWPRPDHPETVRILRRSSASASERIKITPILPENGAVFSMKRDDPKTFSPEFSFETTGTAPASFRFALFGPTFVVAEVDIPANALTVHAEIGKGFRWSLSLPPAGPDVVKDMTAMNVYGWMVTMLDSTGGVIGQSVPRLIKVAVD